MITTENKKDLMINTFKTQFSGMPEELKELKAKKCLAFTLDMHLSLLSQMKREELETIKKELDV